MKETVWYSLGGPYILQTQFFSEGSAPEELKDLSPHNGQMSVALFTPVKEPSDVSVDPSGKYLTCRLTAGDGKDTPGLSEKLTLQRGLGLIIKEQYVNGMKTMTWKLTGLSRLTR